MSWFLSYVRSSIGAKHVMALTGLGMVLFAIVHMIGHLGMFGGPDAYNGYAHFLQGLGALKWIARGGLLAIFLVHIATAIRLVMQNRAARPVAYAAYKPVRSTAAGRYMALTGITLLAFFLVRLVPGDPIETMAGERGIDAAGACSFASDREPGNPAIAVATFIT